jgi:AcrR family transcriptional regulator
VRDNAAVPRRVDHDERRRGLTDALLRIASTRGLKAVTMREVAAEAGVSLRVVQYYFPDKRALMASGLAELVARMDRRVRARAAARGTGLPPRAVLEVVLGSVLPSDDDARADQLAWTAYYAAGLTDPEGTAGLRDEALFGPNALERSLVATLAEAREAGEIAPGLDLRAEVVGLLAMANGLTSGVLGTQRDIADAEAVLRYHLDRLFDARRG